MRSGHLVDVRRDPPRTLRQAAVEHGAEQRTTPAATPSIRWDPSTTVTASRVRVMRRARRRGGGGAERRRHGADVVHHRCGASVEAFCKHLLPPRDLGLEPPAIIGRRNFPGRIVHSLAIGIAQRVPVTDLQNHREAIGQRRVKGFRAPVLLALGLVGRARVHRRPAVAQLRERQALGSCARARARTGVLGFVAADLVDKHRLGAPHRGRRFAKANRGPRLVGIRESDEIDERDQARVVVALLESQRLADGIEQERPRAAAADEQDRLAGGERSKNDRSCASKPSEPKAARRLRDGDGVVVSDMMCLIGPPKTTDSQDGW